MRNQQVVGSRSIQRKNQSGDQENRKQEQDDGNEELLDILLGIGLGVVLGKLFLTVAESNVKGDVASEIADALEAGVGQ